VAAPAATYSPKERSKIMAPKGPVANAATKIKASAEEVWDALVNPEKIKQYMFGSEVTSDWKEGSSITWKGEWQGKQYEDKGEILQAVPPDLIQYSHYSPLSSLPDIPENYHMVTMQLSKEDEYTRLSLTQDNNVDQKAADHSTENWNAMLAKLKEMLETK
jgi:uncharacterized protein YndB with AHSA1/START domain